MGSRADMTVIEDEKIPYGIKLIGGNLGETGKKITLPLYMAMFLHN